MENSRYIVGIDLGTSTCSLAYFDTLNEKKKIQQLAIAQWENEKCIFEHVLLPSYCYLPEKALWRRGQLNLPLHGKEKEPVSYVVGRMAVEKAIANTDRVVHSAKSWFVHRGVDPGQAILPWHSDELIGNDRISPVMASANYLRHLKDAWNNKIAAYEKDYLLENQQIIITVPASFDELAVQLTLEAAKIAGFLEEQIQIVEEPQAAFYDWLFSCEDNGKKLAGKTLLVCDIGGGTSDFSLFEIEASNKIKRVAVSDHILLGGDNFDLQVANTLSTLFCEKYGKPLNTRQRKQLLFLAKNLKEKAFAAENEILHLALAGSQGASLLQATQSIEIESKKIKNDILQGFFPECAKDQKANNGDGALLQLGLPYAQDCAVTHHLAGFLNGRKVDAVLYAGGTLTPYILRKRLTDLLCAWQNNPVLQVDSIASQCAISRGAVCYGIAQRAKTSVISGGYPRSIFLRVEDQKDECSKYICVVPKGLEAEEQLLLEIPGLSARLGQTVCFELVSYNQEATLGEVLLGAEGIKPLATITSKLDKKQLCSKNTFPIYLEVKLRATGVLDLFCVAKELADHKWKLSFNVQAERKATLKQSLRSCEILSVAKLQQNIDLCFGKRRSSDKIDLNPKHLLRSLEEVLGKNRQDWDLWTLRSIWPLIAEGKTRLNRSEAHEAAWLGLAGFVLRPGYGYSLDSDYIEELWSLFSQGLAHSTSKHVQGQWWIMWRRVAAGLSSKQQERILDKIFPALRAFSADPEMIMLAGSLERIDCKQKVRLGSIFCEGIVGKKEHSDRMFWALGRIASRLPLYGGSCAIIRPSFVETWIEALLNYQARENYYSAICFFYSLAARKIADSDFDLSESIRELCLKQLVKYQAKPEQLQVVRECVPFAAKEWEIFAGDSLPSGLLLLATS